MRFIKGILLLLLLVPVLLSFFPQPASACSCAMPGSVEEELKQKTAVFSGKVIDINRSSNVLLQSSSEPVEVLFEVNEVWKGSNKSQVIVHTGLDSASCGFEFKSKKEYIVYAYGENGDLGTGICERTKLLSEASEDKEILGSGNTPTESVDLQERSAFNMYLSIAAICLLILSGVFIVRKRFLRK
ncbi:hypothetical protein [Fredinandcohnia sp. 179-A 10B2 NHS]|uniref:hypothetical protein n=1 Tax=Fredinandcohnia sp. 179-A 10B2 NHS TaxID=3235176 RepID=UPI0039A13D79